MSYQTFCELLLLCIEAVIPSGTADHLLLLTEMLRPHIYI